MLRKLLQSLPGAGRLNGAEEIPTPDLARIFPELRKRAPEPEPEEDTPDTEAVVEQAPMDEAVEGVESITAEQDTGPDVADDFASWLNDDIEAVQQAYRALQVAPGSKPAAVSLFKAAHNLRGTARPYGHPEIERLAGSLCQLLEVGHPGPNSLALINLHVEACRAAARGGEAAADLAEAVCTALEDKVHALTNKSQDAV